MKNVNEDFGITNKVELAYIWKMACFTLIMFIATTLKVLRWLGARWVCTEAAGGSRLLLGVWTGFDAVVEFSGTCVKCPLVCHVFSWCPWCDGEHAGGNPAHSDQRHPSVGFSRGRIRLLWEWPSIFLISFLALLGFSWWGLVKKKSFLLLLSAYEEPQGESPVGPRMDKTSMEVYRNSVWERIVKIRPQIFILWYNASLRDKWGCWQSANEAVGVWVSLLF